MTILLIVVAWVACAVGTAGFWFAYFQGEWPNSAKYNRREDLGDAMLVGLVFGPIGLIVSFFGTGFAEHGWRLR